MYDENFNPILCVKNYSIMVKYCNPIVPTTLVHAGGGSLAKDRVAKISSGAEEKII
jgi:hypothetical protein